MFQNMLLNLTVDSYASLLSYKDSLDHQVPPSLQDYSGILHARHPQGSSYPRKTNNQRKFILIKQKKFSTVYCI